MVGEEVSSGETWVISSLPSSGALSSFSSNINFISNNTSYTMFSVSTGGKAPFYLLYSIEYNTTTAYIADEEPMMEAGWQNEAYRTVTFETSPTGDLLDWLNDNATKQ